jgi:hypothetical protein
MKVAKILILLSGLLIVLNNCSSLSDAGKVLRNEKKSNTDEFFIKKKESLTTPPNYDKIPEPGSTETKESTESSIKKIIKKNRPESQSNKIKSSSTEESILKRIK